MEEFGDFGFDVCDFADVYGGNEVGLWVFVADGFDKAEAAFNAASEVVSVSVEDYLVASAA